MRAVSLSAVLAWGLAGCTGAITINPDVVDVLAGGNSVAFTAVISGGPAATISWTLSGPGSLNVPTGPTVLYTPPTVLQQSPTYANLTAQAGSLNTTASIIIDVAPNALVVNPYAFTVVPGGNPVEISGVLSNGAGVVHWILNGPGALSTQDGASTSYTPPSSLAAPTVAQLTGYVQSLGITSTANVLVQPGATVFVCCYSNASGAGAWSCPTQDEEAACCGNGVSEPGCATDAGACTMVATSNCP